MRILNLVFHPDLNTSRVNNSWKQILEESGKVTTSRDMYDQYPDFQIDVEREQEILLSHDRFIFQFPMYWYSMPPLLKKWLDDVLTYGFAYGSDGDKLAGKDLQVIVSVGGHAHFYSGFDIYATVHELMRPFQLTANLCRMNYMLPLWMFRADAVDQQRIDAQGLEWAATIDDPMRSDAKAYLRSLPDGSELILFSTLEPCRQPRSTLPGFLSYFASKRPALLEPAPALAQITQQQIQPTAKIGSWS